MVGSVGRDSARIMVFCAFGFVVPKDLFSVEASPDIVNVATKVFGHCGFRNACGFGRFAAQLVVSAFMLASAFGVVTKTCIAQRENQGFMA